MALSDALGTPAVDPNAAKRKSRISSILGNDYDFLGDSTDNTQSAFDDILKSTQASNARADAAATDNVLEGLQGRGLAKSGIALKDVMTQVLGPSLERNQQLAAQFGLERAKTQNANDQALNQALTQGRLSSILQGEELTGQKQLQASDFAGRGTLQTQAEAAELARLIKSGELDMARLGAEQSFEAGQRSSDRRTSRQNALVGGLSGAAGSVIAAAFCFDPLTMIDMADGSQRPIGGVRLGEETKGGKVVSIRHAYSDDLRDFRGVRVTGTHCVLDGDKWKRVKDCLDSPLVDDKPHEIVSLVVENHRIYANGMIFDDELETKAEDEHIDFLNREAV